MVTYVEISYEFSLEPYSIGSYRANNGPVLVLQRPPDLYNTDPDEHIFTADEYTFTITHKFPYDAAPYRYNASSHEDSNVNTFAHYNASTTC